MKRVLYISSAVGEMTEADIADILAASRRNNRDAEVTGMLLHLDGGFLQILEGPEAEVEETYARIAADPRHCHVTPLWSETASVRAFPDWTMGFERVPENDPRWDGAFRVDANAPAEHLAPGAGAEIVALMRSFYDCASKRRFA